MNFDKCAHLSKYPHNQNITHLYDPKIFPHIPLQSVPPTLRVQGKKYSINLPLTEFHINEFK